MTRLTAFLAMLLLTAATSHAAIVHFGLDGKAGQGLLPTNVNNSVNGSPGSGGLDVGGITLDTDNHVILINIAWGSANGYADLTGDAIASHIHLPTLDPAPDGFLQNAGVGVTLHSLPGFDAGASNGGFHGAIGNLTSDQINALLEERAYINVHTALNPAGEIRGHLVIIPEPATASLLLPTGLLTLLKRRR